MKRILLALTMSVSLPIYAGINTVFSIDLLSLINHVGNKTISHVNTHKLSNDKILLIYNYPNHGIRIDGNPDNTDWNIDYNLMIIDYNGSIIYSEKNVNLADGDEKFDTNDGVSILKNGAFYIHSRGLDSYDIRDKMGFFIIQLMEVIRILKKYCIFPRPHCLILEPMNLVFLILNMLFHMSMGKVVL